MPSIPKRVARHMFSSIIRRDGSVNGHALGLVARGLRTQATVSAASASDSCAVAWASLIRTSTVPNARCGRTDHQTWVLSMIEFVAISTSR